jgi:hypothetical protein
VTERAVAWQRAAIASTAGATAVVDFFYGPLAGDPYRVSKPLRFRLKGYRSAHRGQYRIIYPVLMTSSWSGSCASPTGPTSTTYAMTGRSGRPTRAVCVCAVSPLGHPLGHSLAPVFLQVRSPGCFHVRAPEALVIPA